MRILVVSDQWAPGACCASVMGEITAAGHEVIDGTDCGKEPGELLRHIQSAGKFGSIILGLQPVGPAECEALVAAGCLLISRDGVGHEEIDLPAARSNGIHVFNTAGVNASAVCELTFALLLAHRRRLIESLGNVRSGGWQTFPGTDLKGATIGVFGLGHIGRRVVIAALGFGMRVVAYDPANNLAIQEFCNTLASLIEALNACGVDCSFVRELSPEAVFEQCDIITLHMAPTDECGASNGGFVNAKTLAQFRNGAVLINTARGTLVNEPALLAALASGKLSAALLDVCMPEPPNANSPLRTLPNVLLTPHEAARSLPTRVHQAQMALANLLLALETSAPLPGNLLC